MKLVIKESSKRRENISLFSNLINTLLRYTDLNIYDFEKDGFNELNRLKNIRYMSVKYIHIHEINSIYRIMLKIDNPILIKIIAEKNPEVVDIEYSDSEINTTPSTERSILRKPDTGSEERLIKTNISDSLYRWSEIANQADSGLNKMMGDAKTRRFILTTKVDETKYFNSVMYLKRISKDAKLIVFKTLRPINPSKTEIVNGFFFDIDGLLFSFGKYYKTRGLRATQMTYERKSFGMEIKGLRLSSKNGRPHAYRIYGVEISQEIKIRDVKNLLGILTKFEISCHESKIFENSDLSYLDQLDLAGTGIMGGVDQD